MGRNSKFDRGEVETSIMGLFWSQGFRNTSVEHLLAATKLRSGSLYRSFGGKRDLFLHALAKYNLEVVHPRQAAILAAPDKVKAIRDFFQGLVERNSNDLTRRGCFNTNSAAELGSLDPEISKALLKSSRKWEGVFFEALEEAQLQGELSKRLDARKMARFFVALSQSLNLLAKIRPDREFLHDVAETGLQILRPISPE
jgi:TetR/AcrR family transcriptional repressor of nem operon